MITERGVIVSEDTGKVDRVTFHGQLYYNNEILNLTKTREIMAKRAPKQKHTESHEPVLATAKTIAHLESLVQSEKSLIGELNKPASIVIGSLALSSIASTLSTQLLLSATSSFMPSIKEMCLWLAGHQFADAMKFMDKIVTRYKLNAADIAQYKIGTNSDNLKTALKQMQKTLSSERIQGTIDDIIRLNNQVNDPTFLPYIMKAIPTFRPIHFSKNDKSSYAKMMYQFMAKQKIIVNNMSAIKTLILEHGGYNLYARSMDTCRSGLATVTVGAVAIPGINKIISLVSSRKPTLTVDTSLFEHEAVAYILHAEKLIADLEEIAATNRKWARKLCIGLIPVAMWILYTFWLTEKQFEELHATENGKSWKAVYEAITIFAMNMFHYACQHLYQDAKDTYQTWHLDDHLQQQKILIEYILTGTTVTEKTLKKKRKATSYLQIECPEYLDDDGNSLTTEEVAEIFKSCALFLKLPAKCRDNVVTLLAEPALTQKNANALKQLLEQNLQRELSIQQLESQLSEVISTCFGNILQFSSKHDDRYLPHYEIEFTLPKFEGLNICDIVHDLFGNNQIEITEERNDYHFKLSGFSAADTQLFQQHRTFFARFIQDNQERMTRERERAEAERPSAFTHQEPEDIVTHQAPIHHTTQTTSVPKSITSTRRVYRWSRDIFDSDNPRCRVHMVRGTTAAQGIFAVNALDRKKMPRNPPDLYETTEEAIRKARMATARGTVGLKLYNPWVVDQNGKPFQADAELKFLGRLGDTRAYAKGENGPGGLLLKIMAIKQNAHKLNKRR